MRTKVTTHGLLIFALAAILAAPATAQMGDLDEIGRMGGVPDLSGLVKMALSGQAPPDVRVDEVDGGLTRIVVPIRSESPAFDLPRKAKDLLGCSITVELFEPDFAAQLVTFDAAPLLNTEYFAGWVTINQSGNDINAQSSIKTKGPGPDINSGNQILSYAASAFNLFFATTGPGGFSGGIHNIQVKVKGQKPGKMQGHFCVGCT